ncbi:MAG: phage tail tape measure protein, partial [Acetatifactor sp.]|nr:phage tail tape measure protein [Acetatifactor sp.]
MAASRIQGITVEIGGDTSKLTAALKGVNTEIRTTQSQLRDVEKLLKLDPGNTELLAQKQRLLNQAVEETKEKLAQLKEASRQANEQLEKGAITQDQYDGLQREIIETEERLKSLETQAAQSAVAIQKIAAVGGDLKNLGDKISGVGTNLTKGVTT